MQKPPTPRSSKRSLSIMDGNLEYPAAFILDADTHRYRAVTKTGVRFGGTPRQLSQRRQLDGD
ncbi:hypothetical protein ACTXG7_11645 [Mycolicibacterium sp. Dal123E01]|uniref:hypothetical protein n=1 Tax=Mycolicibacterium sp. Dal123E01 TaxID=3457578 RepID=UPI00403E7995